MPARKVLSEQDQVRLRKLFLTSDTLKTIAKTMGVSTHMIQKYWMRWFSDDEHDERKCRVDSYRAMGTKNPMWGRKGEKHPNYVNGPILSSDGYLLVMRPSWYATTRRSRIRQHSVVYCEHNQLTKIPKGYAVHHINEVRTDNRIENLQMMTISEHMKLHCKRRKSAETIPNGSRVQEDSKRSPS